MAEDGFEGTGHGFSSEGAGQEFSSEEFVGTLGAYGESASGAPRWRLGRRAAATAAVGLAVALGAGAYGVEVAAGSSSDQGAAPGGAAGLPAGLPSTAPGGGSAPGCGGAFMRGVAGTLKSDNGSTLTVQSQVPNSATETVTTTSSTVAVRIASGSLADVANGDQVLVGGSFANNTLTAKNIVTGNGLSQAPGLTPQGAANWRGSGFASGTVTDKTASGFTVVAMDGGRVTVATSSSPTVETSVKISVSALRVGQRVAVSGTPDSSGKISATQVEELDTTVPGPDLGFGFGPGFGFGLHGFGGPGAPHARPSGLPSNLPSVAPSGLPEQLAPPNGESGRGGFGFGFRGHGKGAPGSCGSATPTPTPSGS